MIFAGNVGLFAFTVTNYLFHKGADKRGRAEKNYFHSESPFLYVFSLKLYVYFLSLVHDF